SLQYQLSKQDQIMLSYMGSVSPPTANQIMPLKDVRDLQNLTVGNPDLKPAVQHGINVDLHRIKTGKGRSYNLSLYASTVRNQVLSELLLLPDTLNSLRQETHFRNGNGGYSLSASFAMTLPISKVLKLQNRSEGSFNRGVSF